MTKEMTDIQKLLMLADTCSDALWGGERGWEMVPFEDFVKACKKAIKNGIKVSAQSFNDEPLEWPDGIIIRDEADFS